VSIESILGIKQAKLHGRHSYPDNDVWSLLINWCGMMILRCGVFRLLHFCLVICGWTFKLQISALFTKNVELPDLVVYAFDPENRRQYNVT
jgi:hypothetical protein